MSKKKFVPMTGLDNLTADERLSYYHDACEYFGIPAEMNLLEFIWLDSGEGDRHLVLYAKKGATDILRAKNDIHVDEMKETIGDGFIMFTAKGHDHNGRTDVAVGAADTKNLSGKQITNAIMTAQTRATRRLTLQFVGGGLLDESEVQATPQTVVTPAMPQYVAPAASVQISTAPGKDITEFDKGGPPNITQEVLEDPIIDPIISDAAKSLGEGMLSGLNASIEGSPKKRRGRKRKSEISLELESPIDDLTESQRTTTAPILGSEPTPFQLAARKALEDSLPKLKKLTDEELEIERMEKRIADIKAKKDTSPKPPAEPVKNLAAETPALVKVEPIVGLPTDVQMKGFKDRLFVYAYDVLPKGGMKGSEGIGGVDFKIKAFIRQMLPKLINFKDLTADQWETFLGFFDEKLAELGPEGLVKLINEKIGAKD